MKNDVPGRKSQNITSLRKKNTTTFCTHKKTMASEAQILFPDSLSYTYKLLSMNRYGI